MPLISVGFTALLTWCLASGQQAPQTIQPSGQSQNGQDPPMSTLQRIDGLLEQINYDRNLRPYFGGQPVRVEMSMTIASIDQISEVDLDYTITLFLRQYWNDDRLIFRGVNRTLSLDGRLVEKLWVPDIFLVNAKQSFLHTVTVDNRLIRIFPNGDVLYGLRVTAKAACPMDLRKYPLDEQNCTLELESYGYTDEELELGWKAGNASVTGLGRLDLSQFTVGVYNTVAKLVKYETGNYWRLVFSFQLYRQIFYFILQTYLPMILLVILSWVSFWVNHESVPARVTLGITTVLTMTTLTSAARSSLPKISYIKAIDVYMVMCFLFVFAALLEYAAVNFQSNQRARRERKKLRKQATEDKDKEVVNRDGNAGAANDSLRNSPSTNACTKRVSIATTSSSQNDENCKEVGGVGIELRAGVGERRRPTFAEVAQKVARRRTLHFKVPEITDVNDIDRWSRFMFPLAFVIFNIIYWIGYGLV
ncbi:PREDICTED: gamma-aminobutyric acid receptor subunit beta-3-like [Branchiostoma belcheri]|uniref:Gamma-aminobutyric acid receptor subunit pi n=1 Tax=Branchiostoma belcheri TaxID=7741 RepID=A0A6P4ZW11_BRABE|nr:PREDICTED: gamma-aminobutyric acid receptor subunit beta-3-like [Branchiostoma belcheri]